MLVPSAVLWGTQVTRKCLGMSFGTLFAEECSRGIVEMPDAALALGLTPKPLAIVLNYCQYGVLYLGSYCNTGPYIDFSILGTVI